MALSFRYRKELFDGEHYYFPKIPVTIHNKDLSIEVPALLDSGATDIFVPKELAEVLGLELKKSDMAESWTGKFKVWESSVGIIVGKGSQTFRKSLKCIVPDAKGESEEVIFGRSFFQFFEITFNEKERKTFLKRTA
mgnify:CR=1 FL=1